MSTTAIAAEAVSEPSTTLEEERREEESPDTGGRRVGDIDDLPRPEKALQYE